MDWPTVTLSEVAEINPRLPKEMRLQSEMDVAFLQMASVSEQGGILDVELRKLEDVVKGFTYLAQGDVIVAKITPCMENGKAAYIDHQIPTEIGFGSTEFHVIRPGPKLDGKYLFHLIWSDKFRFIAEKNMTGTAGQKRVPTSFIQRYKFALPPLDEQRRIAAILDKTEEIKKDTHESEELRDVFTHSLFIDIFGDPVINPMNWEEEKIENLCERIFAGGDVPKDSLSKEYTAEYTIPIYSNGKAEKSLYGFTSIPKVDKDSVTVSARGTIGFPVVRKAPFYPIIRLIVAIPNTEKVNLQYLRSAISYLEFGKGGSSIPQLTVPMLKSRTVLVPPIDLQEKFSRILESVKNVPKSTELAKNNSLSIVQQILN